MRLRALFQVAFATMILPLAGCAELEQTVQDATQKIDQLFESEDAPATAQMEPKPEQARRLYQAGVSARANGDEANAFRQFQDAAKLGHAAAAYEVSRAYAEGRGTERDLAAAGQWTNTAAQLGDPRAQFELGAAYYGGIGVERDYAVAAEFLEKAATQGHAQAQYLLGEAYSNGRGVLQNTTWAARWYGKAAAQGLSDAQYAYGVVHASGLGLPRDLEQGYRWLLLASQNGHQKADVVRRAISTEMKPEAIKRAEAWTARFRTQAKAPYDDAPTVKYVQQVLNTLGYEAGPVDGLPGPKTRNAIRSYRSKAGLSSEGTISPELVERLFSEQSSGSLSTASDQALR